MTILFFKNKLIISLILISALATSLAACAPTIDVRGNLPEKNKIEQIMPGSSNKRDVESILGSPSSKSAFGEDTWYYISSKQERFAFYDVKETERNVLAICFDEQGIVSKINTLDLNDAKNVEFAGKETPSHGHSIGFFEQVFGNIGRFETKK